MDKSEEKKEKESSEIMGRISGLTRLRIMSLILAIGIAVLLMFIGATIVNTSETSGAHKAGTVVHNLGVTALGGALFIGAFNEQLDPNTKMGMMIAAGIILGAGFIRTGITF